MWLCLRKSVQCTWVGNICSICTLPNIDLFKVVISHSGRAPYFSHPFGTGGCCNNPVPTARTPNLHKLEDRKWCLISWLTFGPHMHYTLSHPDSVWDGWAPLIVLSHGLHCLKIGRFKYGQHWISLTNI